MMKISSNLLVLLFLASILLGCKKDDTPIGGNEDVTIELNNNYIQFSAGIETRGVLNTANVLTDNFAVLGYQYPGEWINEKSRAVPNVFKGDDDELLSRTPQLVTYEKEGYYTYTNPQVWTGNKYSFFGYYPSEHDAISLFGDVNDNIEGDPYFMFTLPIFLSNVADTDHTSLIDLLTAANTDTRFGASPNGVLMNMQHRLAAVDVAFRNYSKHNYTVENADGEEETVSAPVRVQVTGCTVNLNNIVKTAKIYLDHTVPTYYIDPELEEGSEEYIDAAQGVFGQGQFSIISSPVEVGNGGEITAVVTSNPDASLLLIPQREHLSGTINLSYKMEYLTDTDSDTWVPIMNESSEIFNTGNKTFEFTRELVQGRRYYIEVTFTSNAITLQTMAADEWDYFEEVKHEFE